MEDARRSDSTIASIQVRGHRWSNVYGNTYFRAQVLVDDVIVHTDTTNQHGYGRENLYAWKVLIKLGYLPAEAAMVVPKHYCRNHGIVFMTAVTDGLKRDLVF